MADVKPAKGANWIPNRLMTTSEASRADASLARTAQVASQKMQVSASTGLRRKVSVGDIEHATEKFEVAYICAKG